MSEESSEVTEVTPDLESSESQPESSGAVEQEAQPEETQEEPQVPFHEHPRFKELIEERRAYKEQLDQTRGYIEALQKQVESLRTPQVPQAPKEPKYKPLIEQLKAINPEFAQFQEELINRTEQAEKRAEAAETYQKRLDDYERREFQNNVLSQVNSLYETNKVPESLRKRYEREMRDIANQEESSGKKLGVQDVPRIFKMVHDEYSAFLEGLRRDTLKGYVQAKSQDTTPSPVTGGAAISSTQKKIRADDEVSQVQWLAQQLRAAKNLN